MATGTIVKTCYQKCLWSVTDSGSAEDLTFNQQFYHGVASGVRANPQHRKDIALCVDAQRLPRALGIRPTFPAGHRSCGAGCDAYSPVRRIPIGPVPPCIALTRRTSSASRPSTTIAPPRFFVTAI